MRVFWYLGQRTPRLLCWAVLQVEIRWEDILEKQQLLGEAEEEDDRTGGAGVGGEDGEDGGVRGGRGARAPRSVYMFHMDLDDPSDDECVAAPHLRQSSASGPGSEVSLQPCF